jgi:hypothetical protein
MKVGGQVRYRLPDIEAYEAAQLRATSIPANFKPAAPLRLVRA